jgi:hypothetical protein
MMRYCWRMESPVNAVGGLRVYVFDSSHSVLAWIPSHPLRSSLHCPSVFLPVDLFMQWNV